MADPFIGEVRTFGFAFAPKYWARCDGQVIEISQNPALFSIVGNTYGGDGKTTFALPDLRGMTAAGATTAAPPPTSFGYLVMNFCIALNGVFPLRG